MDYALERWRDGCAECLAIFRCPIFVSDWMPALSDCAAAHGLPSAEALLEKLPALDSILRQAAARLHSRGVSEARDLSTLTMRISERELTKFWTYTASSQTVREHDETPSVANAIAR